MSSSYSSSWVERGPDTRHLLGSVRTQVQRRCPPTSLVSCRRCITPATEYQMACAHCAATTIGALTMRTQLGYQTFRCPACQRQFNERTGTPYNYLEFPRAIVLLLNAHAPRRRLRPGGASCYVLSVIARAGVGHAAARSSPFPARTAVPRPHRAAPALGRS